MKVSLKKDSLAYQFGVRPGVILRDVSWVMLDRLAIPLNEYMGMDKLSMLAKLDKSLCVDYNPKGNPERDAVAFYLMNHAVSIVRHRKHPYESLGAYLPIVEEYHNLLAIRAMRMFYYMLLICTRETRHEHGSASFWHGVKAKYGKPVVDFYYSIKGIDSMSAKDIYLSDPPLTSLGVYTSFMESVFEEGNFSSAFGGGPWAKVAGVLNDYVHGKISAEILLDTAFTLCHNNGPIFNKGMMYEGYTPEIYKILDVQRSGQIPQMVANKETKWASDPEIKALYNMCHEQIGAEFEGHVDWFLVEELGAKHKYHSEKNEQTSKYGLPTKFKAKVEAEEAKKKLEEMKAEQAKAKSVEIYPGLFIEKMEVNRE